MCAAIHAALAASSTDRRLWLVLAGVFGGAATAIKYTSVFTLLPALVASLMRGSLAVRAGRAAIVVVAFALTVATTNHFLWWDFPNFVLQLSDQVGITGPGHWAASANPPAFHTDILARFGVGWVLLILAAAFGVHGLATGRPHAWVFWLCPLIYSWFTTKRPSQFPRWVFPLLPFVAVAGASALVAIVAIVRKWPVWTNRPSGAVLGKATLALVAVAALGQPLWMGAITTSQRFKPSTHDVVEHWLHQRPSGERVLVPNGWLDLTSARLTVRRVGDFGAVLQGSPYALAANDWVVVPETFFKSAGLRRLTSVTRVGPTTRCSAASRATTTRSTRRRSCRHPPDRSRCGSTPPRRIRFSGWSGRTREGRDRKAGPFQGRQPVSAATPEPDRRRSRST